MDKLDDFPVFDMQALRNPMEKRLLVKCDEETLKLLNSDHYFRTNLIKEIKRIQDSSSSSLNFVGHFVSGFVGGKPHSISIQEVLHCDGIIFADKDSI